MIDMTVTQGGGSAGAVETGRGERTRALILEASRQLFLERGYAGTPINAITEACGISRAGFDTYFKEKQEGFTVLGESAYHDVMDVLSRLDNLSRPFERPELRGWIGEYFASMYRHGAFVLTAWGSAPDEEAFRWSR